MRPSVTFSLPLAILLAIVCPLTGEEREAGRSEKANAEGLNSEKQCSAKVDANAAAPTATGPNATGPNATGPNATGADESSPAEAAGEEKSARGKAKKLPGFTGEREAAAMTFVRTNHPELADLLDQLKVNNPSQYQKAIRDLFKSSERLAQIEERNPQRYPLELSFWKVNSRIQVLVAKMTMSPAPATEDQLRQALAEQIQLRRQLLSDDRRKLEQKLSELTSDLDDLEQHQQQRIDRQMAELLGHASRTRPLVNRPATSKKSGGEPKNGRDKNPPN